MERRHLISRTALARVTSVGMAVTLALLVLQSPSTTVSAGPSTSCAPGQAPQFQLGFAFLKGVLGSIVGDPVECEHPDADGNTLQKTTTGTLFWRKSTNRSTFTAGDQHWAWTAHGLVQWTGASVDPPGELPAGGGSEQQAIIEGNSARMLEEGRNTFRFDTFGSEAFFGDTLKLHRAIEGAKFGGVGPGVSPKTALAVGLKVDADALPGGVKDGLAKGQVNLDDPATTLALLQMNAVVGVTGTFNTDGSLKAVGIQCSLCHATVDNSFAPGIGRRLDGWPNRDLNVGAIIALSPDLSAADTLLGVDDATTRKVLGSWGPGKFDAELFLDGKGFRPDGQTAAVLLPPAYGLAGVNQHTWTGGWGGVTYWNAFVANLEMHGSGTFYDPRLNDPVKYPVAARAGSGNVRSANDHVTAKLAALQYYQLAIPAPKPPEGSFDPAAATRGKSLFDGKAQCATCHVPPLYTEPGWNLHTPDEIGIDAFQANRAPDNRYRTAPLKGLWSHQQGGFYHDGRFATLRDVVDHYNGFLKLGLSDQDERDLIDYLKSL